MPFTQLNVCLNIFDSLCAVVEDGVNIYPHPDSGCTMRESGPFAIPRSKSSLPRSHPRKALSINKL
jgi:hypothetical protein